MCCVAGLQASVPSTFATYVPEQQTPKASSSAGQQACHRVDEAVANHDASDNTKAMQQQQQSHGSVDILDALPVSQQTGNHDQYQPPQHSNKQAEHVITEQQNQRLPAASIMAGLRHAQEGQRQSNQTGSSLQAENSSSTGTTAQACIHSKPQQPLDNSRRCTSHIDTMPGSSTSEAGTTAFNRMQLRSLSQPAERQFLTAGDHEKALAGPLRGWGGTAPIRRGPPILKQQGHSQKQQQQITSADLHKSALHKRPRAELTPDARARPQGYPLQHTPQSPPQYTTHCSLQHHEQYYPQQHPPHSLPQHPPQNPQQQQIADSEEVDMEDAFPHPKRPRLDYLASSDRHRLSLLPSNPFAAHGLSPSLQATRRAGSFHKHLGSCEGALAVQKMRRQREQQQFCLQPCQH